MKLLGAFFVLLFSTITLAQQDQILPNGKWAYYGAEFYNAVASGKKLDKALFTKVLGGVHKTQKGQFDQIASSDCSKGCYKHTSVGYDKARKIMFGELDKLQDNNGTYVLDVYCGKKFYFTSLDEVSQMHTKVNIEHTWPQSKFTNQFPKDMQKSDMHHLFLTDSKANSVRGNTPFGFVGFAYDRNDDSGCSLSRNGFIDGNDFYTPPTNHRGNVARALFYFSMRYNLPITATEEQTLRKWHKADPVDADEIRRHEGIAKHQKVRNPFVDHPELVDRISDF